VDQGRQVWRTEGRIEFPTEVGLSRGAKGKGVGEVQSYLAKFGYLQADDTGQYEAARQLDKEEKAEPDTFDDATEHALRAFQRFHELPETGELDDATVAQMSIPRCGFPDLSDDALGAFVAQGNRWKKDRLRYRFMSFTPDVPKENVRSATSRAFDLWAKVTPLSFEEVERGEEAEIVISFAKGDHGDGSANAFDGQGGTLAHAYYPPPNGGAIAGDAHFDEAETWSVSVPVPQNRFDLITVAAHEFGHSLGLAHSSVRGALMFPSYGGPHRFLHRDDIRGIRDVYGS
jgi:Matrixin/Putative peptidoglycan binding domain